MKSKKRGDFVGRTDEFKANAYIAASRYLTKGHTATVYIAIVVALLFIAYSYGKMVQAYPTAGSTYTYTQKSFSPYVGFLIKALTGGTGEGVLFSPQPFYSE